MDNREGVEGAQVLSEQVRQRLFIIDAVAAYRTLQGIAEDFADKAIAVMPESRVLAAAIIERGTTVAKAADAIRQGNPAEAIALMENFMDLHPEGLNLALQRLAHATDGEPLVSVPARKLWLEGGCGADA